MAETSAQIWAHVRSLRSAPPGQAGTGVRRSLFGAALEQSEQLFQAAAATSPAVQPILLFYGLSQAGRALVAAHGSDPIVRGHGIRASGLEGEIRSVLVRDNGIGAFQRVADVIGSDTLPEGATFAALYAALPASVPVLLDVSDVLPSLVLTAERETTGAMVVMSYEAKAWVQGLPVSMFSLEHARFRQEAAAMLDAYPGLAGWSFTTEPSVPAQVRTDQGGPLLRLRWLSGGSNELARQARVRNAAPLVPGTGRLWAIPRIGGGSHVAPLLLWWAVLYATSMLARYEPGAWVRLLRPDDSDAAVALESILSAALDQVPALILAALHDPSHWRPVVEPQDS